MEAMVKFVKALVAAAAALIASTLVTFAEIKDASSKPLFAASH